MSETQTDGNAGGMPQRADFRTTTGAPVQREAAAAPVQPKEDFLGPESFGPKSQRDTQRKTSSEIDAEQALVDKTNSAMGGGGDNDKDITASDGDIKLAAVTEEELEMAQQLIFRGFAEKKAVFPNLKLVITAMSTSADDMDMINEVVFDLAESYRDDNVDDDKVKEGEPKPVKKKRNNAPMINLDSYRHSVMLAMSISTINDDDLSKNNSLASLSAIKSGVEKINTYLANGDTDKAESLKVSVKRTINFRAKVISGYPTPVIDMMSSIKAKFDDRMIEILNNPDVFPKS